jgi:hypothetical protein
MKANLSPSSRGLASSRGTPSSVMPHTRRRLSFAAWRLALLRCCLRHQRARPPNRPPISELARCIRGRPETSLTAPASRPSRTACPGMSLAGVLGAMAVRTRPCDALGRWPQADRGGLCRVASGQNWPRDLAVCLRAGGAGGAKGRAWVVRRLSRVGSPWLGGGGRGWVGRWCVSPEVGRPGLRRCCVRVSGLPLTASCGWSRRSGNSSIGR